MRLEAAAAADVLDASFKRLPAVLVTIQAGQCTRLWSKEEEEEVILEGTAWLTESVRILEHDLPRAKGYSSMTYRERKDTQA